MVVTGPSGLQDIPATSSASGGRGRGRGRRVHRAASASSTPHLFQQEDTAPVALFS